MAHIAIYCGCRTTHICAKKNTKKVHLNHLSSKRLWNFHTFGDTSRMLGPQSVVDLLSNLVGVCGRGKTAVAGSHLYHFTALSLFYPFWYNCVKEVSHIHSTLLSHWNSNTHTHAHNHFCLKGTKLQTRSLIGKQTKT